MGRVAPPRRIVALAAALAATAAPIALGACSSSGGGSSSEACPTTVDATVHANNSYRFLPDKLTAKAGKFVVKLVEDGSLEHTFQIHGLAGKASVNGDRKESCKTFTLEKGTYNFYCGVEGHENLGMKGTLEVS